MGDLRLPQSLSDLLGQGVGIHRQGEQRRQEGTPRALGSSKPLTEHKARKGGKVRVSQGGTGVRVMFSEEADMALWQTWAEQAARGKKPPAS